MISDWIDKIYAKGSQDLIHEVVSVWKFLDKDDQWLQALIRNKAYDEISILIYRYPNNPRWKFTSENFKDVIENNGLELIQWCLQEKECRLILENVDIQNIIISNYWSEGHKMYYGAEMLSHVKKTSLDLSLAYTLLKTVEQSIKNKIILNCHSPVLTCLLLCEILANIGEISVHFHTQCEKTRIEWMTFCKNIHEANPNEKYIKFLLGQKDSKGRTAYQIAAETEAFMVLESPEVGTIVNKMWVGRWRHDGILAFSSLKKFIESPGLKNSNPFISFDSIDTSKTYFHQLCLWEESCSLRYYPESLSTILLIVLYNWYIFFWVTYDEVMFNTSQLSINMQMMLACYITWVACIVLNIPLQILYCFLSGKRKYTIDYWGFIEISLWISALLILIDTENLFPTQDEEGNIIPSDGKSDVAFVVRAAILSVNDIFVWLRITGILLTYKELGPWIRMIYLLSIITGKYLLIYLILMIAAATIYTTIFFRASPNYETYSITFTTLFQGYLNNSDCFNFAYYEMFGAICCIAFVTVGGLILVNMLIALLSSEYTRLSKVVDAAHRSVLINYFKRYKWDKNYGYWILLTTPLNIINFLIIPINLLFRDKTKSQLSKWNNSDTNSDYDENCVQSRASWEFNENSDDVKVNKHVLNSRQQNFNRIVSRIYYTILYFPIILITEVFWNVFLVPVCYIVGIYSTIIDYYTQHNEKNYWAHICIILGWLLFGLPFLWMRFVIDAYNWFHTLYVTVDINAYDWEKKRIKEFIRPEDIRNFLQFIHKREHTEQNDLHTLFIDYLEFEHQKKAETDTEFKKQALYLHKLRNAGKTTTKKAVVSISSIYKTNTKNNKSNADEKDENGLSGRTTKRNWIIIEIWENFWIDDGSDNFIVDIDKMKMLLPKTMNINNAYIKRLVHTDIASLNKAVNKRKNKANAFLQHKWLNKIVGSIIRLDKIIDAEGNTDPLQSEEAKKENKFDIEENEDDFYSTLEDLLRKIGDDIGDNIRAMDIKIQTEENRVKMNKKKKTPKNGTRRSTNFYKQGMNKIIKTS